MEGPVAKSWLGGVPQRALPLDWLGSVPHGGPCHWPVSEVHPMEGPATVLARQRISHMALPLAWLC
jgi:hypothetical protein